MHLKEEKDFCVPITAKNMHLQMKKLICKVSMSCSNNKWSRQKSLCIIAYVHGSGCIYMVFPFLNKLMDIFNMNSCKCNIYIFRFLWKSAYHRLLQMQPQDNSSSSELVIMIVKRHAFSHCSCPCCEFLMDKLIGTVFKDVRTAFFFNIPMTKGSCSLLGIMFCFHRM